jgi:hypothetical protein
MKATEILPTEYFEYYKQYVDLVDDLPLVDALRKGHSETVEFFETLPESKHHFQYANGKWTPKEILLHVIDCERVFAYRALYFARDENGDLRGFDENTFGKNCNANTRTMDDLLEEYTAVRNASICLFKSFDDTVLKRGGKANNNQLSVRACGFIICGHEKHHRRIIEERYL